MTDLTNNEPQVPENDPTPTSALTPPVEPTPPGSEGDPAVDQPEAINSIDDYKVEVENFNFDDFKAFPENQEFLERAREAGFGNKELGFLLGEYNQLLPEIMKGNSALDAEACTEQMKTVWGGETEANFGFAQAAAQNAIQNGILTTEEINSPEFGNNPLVLKMAAYFGKQLQEDTPPSNTQQNSGEDVQSLMRSEAYLNPQHADHKRVYAKVEQFYQKQYK